MCYISGRPCRFPCQDLAIRDCLSTLWGRKTRLSEFAREQGEKIEFPRRTPAEIRAAAESGQLIPNGETFHRVPQSVIRLPIPLAALSAATPFDLAAALDERINDGKIRYFQSGVYVCDEW